MHAMILHICVIYCILPILEIPHKAIASTHNYTAAVVEYYGIDDVNNSISIEEKLVLRAKDQIQLLESINKDIEIILFPEKSLSFNADISKIGTVVPKKFDKIICNSTDRNFQEYLKLFSCAAIKCNTSIAINVIEEEEHSNDSDIVYYNSVVVFDHDGYVSGRYRKWNLFGEFSLSKPKEMDLTTITTKNNLTFGVFTCFDIIFNAPALNLTRNLKVKNILFPSNWISELPYLTALQVQQMWAHENNIILLSSGANNPKTGASGSGIFLGAHGPLKSIFIGGTGGSEVLVKTVPNLEEIDPNYFNSTSEDTDKLAKNLDDFYLLRDLSMDDHASILMKENVSGVVEEVCSGNTIEICCLFNINITINETAKSNNYYRYRLAAFNGIRSFSGLRYAGIESCGIVACLNESLSSCALRYSNYSEISWPIIFENITIEANFSADENRIQYPNSLLSSMRPISPRYTAWEKEEFGAIVKRKHVLNKQQNRLLTFGIFGRDFNRDTPLISISSGTSRPSTKFFLLVFYCFNYYV